MLHNASLLIDDIQDNSKLRRGVPVAHNIYGVPLTINAANYIYFLAMQKALTLRHPDVTQIFVGLFENKIQFFDFFLFIYLDQMLELHHGQGMEIWWRDNFVSPSEDEYRQMVIRKCGGLFNLGVRLMQLFAPIETRDRLNFDRLCQLLSLLFQIRDDYCNLISKEYATNKSYCEDLTEGKFSFPILHAVNTRETDTRIIHILKQRTQDVELKRYCVQLLHEFGSIEYTRQSCDELAKQVYDEIDVLGGNNYLENLIQGLMEVFRNDNDSGNGQDIEINDRYVSDQIDEDEQYHHRGYKKITTNINGRYHT
jgi:geranylgeranyl diphosphate synthase type 3